MRRQKIRQYRKAIGAQPSRSQEEEAQDKEENMPPWCLVTQALREKENATKLSGASGSSAPPKKKQKIAHATEDPPSEGVKKVTEGPKNLSPPPASPSAPVEDVAYQGGHRDSSRQL